MKFKIKIYKLLYIYIDGFVSLCQVQKKSPKVRY